MGPRLRRRLAVALSVVGAAIAVATPVEAGDSTITAPRIVYTGVGQTIEFTGTDSISNESRVLTMDASISGSCNPTAGNGWSISLCGRVQISLTDGTGGTLFMAGTTQVQSSPVVYRTASGAIVENPTDPAIWGGPVLTVYMNGTLDQLNGALADLEYIPAADYEDGTYDEVTPPGAGTPNIDILVNDGSVSSTNATAEIILRVEGPNGGPTLAGPASALTAAAGVENAYPPSTSDPALFSVVDPELCLRSPNNRCDGAYDAAPAPLIPEPHDAMLLVAWLPQAGCGQFALRSVSGFANLGGAAFPSVNAILTSPTGLDLEQPAADAILATLGLAGAVNLSGQSSGNNLTTVFAGTAGSIADVRYALSQLTYAAPAAETSCTLNFAFADLGNNGMPQEWVPPDPPVGEYEIPNALASSISVTFNVVDTHPDVTIDQIIPSLAGDPAGPNKPSGFRITFGEPIDPASFDTSDLSLATSSASGAAFGALVPVTPGLVYTVPVTATGDGTITLTMAAGGACAAGHFSGSCDAGYDSEAPVYSDNEIEWDQTAPTATMVAEAGQPDPTSAATVYFTLDVSDTVSTAPLDIADSEIGLSGTANPTTAAVSWPDITKPKQFRVAVSGMNGTGTVAAKLLAGAFLDQALNPNTASADAVINFDNAPPTVAVTPAAGQPNPTSGTQIEFTVTFSENVTGFDDPATDLVLGGSALPTSAVITGGPAIYTVTVTGMSVTGTVTSSVPAGAAQDAALLDNAAAPAAASVQWELPVAAQVAFVQQPTDAASGATIAPAVTVQLLDAGANPVAIAGTTVTLSLTSGTGTLAGTASQVTNASGLATFADLSIDLAGAKQLTAASAGLTSALSGAFSITVGPVSQLAYVQPPTPAAPGATISPAVTVQLQDAAGNPVAVAGTTVTISLTSGTGALSGTASQLTDAAGLATFADLSIDTSGPKQLTAASAGLTSAVSSTFSITAAAATQVAFVQQPTDAASGATITPAVTVQLLDAGANPVAIAGTTVTLSLTNGTGVLSGTASQVTNASGLATFADLSIDLAGAKQLTAASAGLSSALSGAFTIAAGPASQLVYVQPPTPAAPGATITPAVTVQLRDAAANPVAVAGTTVTISLTSGTGALSGTASQLTDAAGLATFADLSIDTSGPKQLTAASAGLTSAVSSTFSITAATATQVAFVQQPTDAASGAAIAPAVTVQLLDAGANPVAIAGTTVTLSLTSGTGTLAGTASQVTNAAGLATFIDLSIDVAGAKQLTAASAGLVSALSGAFTITAGPASQLVYIQPPTPAAPGATITPAVTVQLRDAASNPVAVAGTTITISLTNGTGILSGTASQLTDAAGLATFADLSIDTSGPKQLTAASAGLTSAVSSTFSITAATATQVAFVQQPTDAASGAAIAPAVTVQLLDAGANPVAIAGTTVTLSLTSGTGTLAGTASQVTNAAGLATFIDLSIDLAGAKQLTAASAGLTSALSGAFTITAGPAAAIAVTAGSLQSAPADGAFLVPLLVTVTDAGGNPVSGVTVTFLAPISGPSALLSNGGIATTNAAGQAWVTATANGIPGGPYIVTASIGALPAAAFALTNLSADAIANVPVLGGFGIGVFALLLAAVGAVASRGVFKV
ncbi:MAG: hypothetical protein RBU36_13950 [Thermoanaerobaculia bacterium]|jgi:hypothetical protein|nr:hypothetical protein [Thermoanaerobaculia bacterium]